MAVTEAGKRAAATMAELLERMRAIEQSLGPTQGVSQLPSVLWSHVPVTGDPATQGCANFPDVDDCRFLAARKALVRDLDVNVSALIDRAAFPSTAMKVGSFVDQAERLVAMWRKLPQPRKRRRGLGILLGAGALAIGLSVAMRD